MDRLKYDNFTNIIPWFRSFHLIAQFFSYAIYVTISYAYDARGDSSLSHRGF